MSLSRTTPGRPPWLTAFVIESNRIEGIPGVETAHVDAHAELLAKRRITIADLEDFVAKVQPGAVLRGHRSLNVQVGEHTAPRGGEGLVTALRAFLEVVPHANPFVVHSYYQTLHPFTDGNGRSGRALWLWAMSKHGERSWQQARELGFLHCFYYQALARHDRENLNLLGSGGLVETGGSGR